MKLAISLSSAGLAVLITVAFSLTVLQGLTVGICTGIAGGLLIVAMD